MSGPRPSPPLTIDHRLHLLLGAALALLVVWHLEVPSPRPALPPNQPAPRSASAPTRAPSTVRKKASSTTASGEAVSREQIIASVTRVYREALLTRELDLGQRRYAEFYWQSDRGGGALAEIRAHRDALRESLEAEANAVLARMLPAGAAEKITLATFFDDNHPAPNVRFLSAESRARFEAAVVAAGRADPDTLANIAGQILPPAELAVYHQWNDRANVALRDELIGFGADEREFLAIAQAERRDPQTGEPNGTTAPDLEATLGEPRYLAYRRQTDPALWTALHDLNRTGLPLEYADWLAATRRDAAAATAKIWQDATLPTELKQQRVAATLRAFDASVAAKLSTPGCTVDELPPLP